jgi:hypothetical protein
MDGCVRIDAQNENTIKSIMRIKTGISGLRCDGERDALPTDRLRARVKQRHKEGLT